MPNVSLTPTPLFTRPELLRHGQIPQPLSGVAPREIEGKDWWDLARREAYAKNNYCCWACGALPEDPLSAHEVYEIDYEHGRTTFVEVVALCTLCHNFIHCGRLAHLLVEHKVSKDQFKETIRHGVEVLKKANLQAHWGLRVVLYHARGRFPEAPKWMENAEAMCDPLPSTHVDIPWDKWRMTYKGKEYGPIHKSKLGHTIFYLFRSEE